jgi:predicted O-methyltransferase YrrM
MQRLKSSIRKLLGEQTVGMLDYYRHPKLRAAWGGPFNGQSCRQRLFEAIVDSVRPQALIETGTYRGTTTESLAATGLPVYTIEGNARYYGFARARLRRESNVTLCRGDSRAELERLFAGPLKGLLHAPLFFYLDAHWNDELPLAEEIASIFSRAPNAVVMVDDFAVPDDPGFAYDDYGPGKALNAAYIAPLVEAHDLAIFYPSQSSQQETGQRRGCVVLCKATVFGGRLKTVSLLRSGNEFSSAASSII